MSELDVITIMKATADNYRERAIGAEDLAWELWAEIQRMSTKAELQEVKRRLQGVLGEEGKQSFKKLRKSMQGIL